VGFALAVVSCSLLLAWVALLVLMVPKFAAVFTAFEAALPWSTRTVLAVAHVAQEWYFLVLPVLGLVLVGLMLLPFIAPPRVTIVVCALVLVAAALAIAGTALSLFLPLGNLVQEMRQSA
jgi:hypothetical protein